MGWEGGGGGEREDGWPLMEIRYGTPALALPASQPSNLCTSGIPVRHSVSLRFRHRALVSSLLAVEAARPTQPNPHGRATHVPPAPPTVSLDTKPNGSSTHATCRQIAVFTNGSCRRMWCCGFPSLRKLRVNVVAGTPTANTAPWRRRGWQRSGRRVRRLSQRPA